MQYKATQILNALIELNKDELMNIKGIGTKLADNIIMFGHSPRAANLFDGFEILENNNRGLDINIVDVKSLGSICITGTFIVPRNKIVEQLELAGYKASNAITKSTNYCLVGDDAGSKESKAMELGVKIIRSLEELNNILGIVI
jgi:DNA ligase (NAD+)